MRIQSGENVYVRWQLQMSFDVMGSERRSNTVGMTHLRFDDSGKIATSVDMYARYPDFEIDIEREQAALVDHDRIILQFPNRLLARN